MVVPLGPGKFYGSSLPRPRIYTDVKLSDKRVDPPVSVLDPLLSWAYEAHWSMGGLSFKRLRLQGRIEGNVNKLRKEREKALKMKKKMQNSTPIIQSKSNGSNRGRKGGNYLDSPPPAPISKKRRLRSMRVEEEDDTEPEEDELEDVRKLEVENGGMKRKRRRLVRKLGDDFELVAKSPSKDTNNEGIKGSVALRTRSRRSMVMVEEHEESQHDAMSKMKKAETENGKDGKISEDKGSSSPNGTRSSPRLKLKQ